MAERQHPEERDVDSIFESIVARFDEPSAEVPDADPGHGTAGPGAAPGPPRRQSTGDVTLPSRPARRGPPQSTGDVRLPGPPAGTEPRSGDDGFGEAVPWRTDPTNSVADALMGEDAHPGTADDDEGFTPPPPAPLPPLSDRLFWGAVVGLVLGPVGLLWLVLTGTGGFWSMTLVISLIVGGFACIVLRQPTDRGYDPDDGARV